MPSRQRELALQLIAAHLADSMEIDDAVERGDTKASPAMLLAWGDIYRDVDHEQLHEEVLGQVCEVIAAFCTAFAPEDPFRAWRYFIGALGLDDGPS